MVVTESADRDLAQWDRAAADGDVLLVDLGFVRTAPRRSKVICVQATVGQGFELGGELRGAGAQRDEPQLGGVQFGEAGAGGDLGVEHQQLWRVTGRVLPVARERDHLRGVVGFRAGGVGVDEVAGLAVLGEERQHRLGPLRTPRDVVRFQGDVVAEVHDRVEVQIEIGVVGLTGSGHRPGQTGQQFLVVRACEPVAVTPQRAGLR